MSYNRWLAPDELEHHQRKGAHWGVHNGPPYPLERQKRFSPDGGKVSQKKYLQATGSGGTTAKRKHHTTSEKTEHQRKQSAERQERKANPEGTAWEQMERNNPINKLKGAYRRYKKNQERIAEEERAEKANFNNAMDRLNKLDIPDDIKRKMRNEALGYDPDDKLRGQHWGTRNGPPYPPRDAMRIDFDGDNVPMPKQKDPLWDNTTFSGDDTDSERLNKIIDSYLDKQKERKEAAKQHGTAEEVMKYRDTFTKEEWKEIADRLEAEARVKRLLDKPVTAQNNQGGQQNQNKQNQNTEPAEESIRFANSKAKDIYEKGTAREIYDNRDKFTTEQLETVTRRLEAEEKIGKYADVQVKIKSNKQLNFEKARDYLKIAGDSAEAISKIMKLLDGSGSGNNKGNGSSKVEQVAKVISGVANAGEGGGNKKNGQRKKG